MSDSERLNEIRRRFVGSGEEHELLARVCCEYQAAYDRGAKDRETELLDQARADTDALRFAHTLSQLNYNAQKFIQLTERHDPTDEYSLDETARWLKSIGRTPEQLRKLADAVEQIASEVAP